MDSIFEILKKEAPNIIHNFVKKEGGFAKFLEIVKAVRCEQTQTKMLGEALSCPDLSIEDIQNSLRTRGEEIMATHRRRHTGIKPVQDDLMQLMDMVISDRPGLSFEDAFTLLDSQRVIYPTTKIIHRLIRMEGGLAKYLERVEKVPEEHIRTRLLEEALSCPDLSFEDVQNIVRNRRDEAALLTRFIGCQSSFYNTIKCLTLLNDRPGDKEQAVRRVIERFRILSVNQLVALLDHIQDPEKFFTDFIGKDNHNYMDYANVLHLSILLPELVKEDIKYKYLEDVVPRLMDRLNQRGWRDCISFFLPNSGWNSINPTFAEYASRPLNEVRAIVLEADLSFAQAIGITQIGF